MMSLALAVVLAPTPSVHADDGERTNERRTLQGYSTPSYGVSAPASGEIGRVALALAGMSADTYWLPRALTPHIADDALLVMPQASIAQRDDLGGFASPYDVSPERIEEEQLIALKIARESLVDAIREYDVPDGVPMTVIGCYEGAETALSLILEQWLPVDRLILIDPDPAGLPTIDEDTTMVQYVDAPSITAFFSLRAATELPSLIEALNDRLGPWAANARVFGGRVRGGSLNDLIEHAFAPLDGYSVYDTSTDRSVSFDAMAAVCADADVVFFGELHDNVVGHRLEAKLFEALYAADPNLAIAMEMFERDVQAVLDQYVAGEIDEAEFLAGSRPWPNYSTDYRQMIELARENGLPAIAGNVPRRLSREISRGGIDAFDSYSEEDRAFVARKLIADDGPYRDRFYNIMQAMMGAGTHGGPDATFDLFPIYAAQCLKDDTMAESIADFLAISEGTRVLHVNGSFHSDYHLAVPDKLSRLLPDLEIVTISMQIATNPKLATARDYPKNVADYVVFVPEPEPQITAFSPPPAGSNGSSGTDSGTGSSGSSDSSDASTPARVLNYDPAEVVDVVIDVALDPATHGLAGSTTMTFPPAVLARYVNSAEDAEWHYELPMYLDHNLGVSLATISATTASGDAIDYEYTRPHGGIDDPPGADPDSVILKLQGPLEEPAVVTLEYSGEINYPIRSDQSLTEGLGDSTPGIIVEEGAFLGGVAWYPVLAGQRLSMFTVDCRVPEGWRAVTQGNLVDTTTADGVTSARWEPVLPCDGITLVAGPYTVTSDESASGVTVSAYLFESHAELAPIFLGEAIKFVDYYSELLGPYPYTKFDIVENFFSTGYGMPSYTLLGARLIAMGPMATLPGMLDHEVAHCWWGNSVYYDSAEGNWCEALTTYCSNYHSREVFEQSAQMAGSAASEMRNSVIGYSLAVDADNAFPLRQFRYKVSEVAGAIGYSKGHAFFHVVRTLLGDDAFWGALREVFRTRVGNYATWDHFEAAFIAQASSDEQRQDVATMFDQWLDRADIPDLSLERDEATGGFVIVQHTDEPYLLPVTVEVSNTPGGATLRKQVMLRGARTPIETERPPVDPNSRAPGFIVAVDPDLAVMRRLTPEEIPPSVGTLLASDSLVVVLPSSGPAAWLDSCRAVGERAAADGATVVTDAELTDEMRRQSSLLILGTPEQNSALGRYASACDGRVTFAGGLAVDGEPLPADADLLASFSNPEAPGQVVTLFAAQSESGQANPSRIFHYRWDTLIVFRGRPSLRLTLPSSYDRCRQVVPGQ